MGVLSMTRISLKKKILFYFVMLISVVFLIEFFSFAAFFIIKKEWFSFSRIYSERNSRSYEIDTLTSRGGKKGSADNQTIASGQVIHPYLGYVYSPEYNKEEYSNIPISEYGFVDNTGPIHAKSNDRVILGIFGGSVAFWFSVHGIDSLISELRKSPEFLNKEIVIVRTAVYGYKQPQQLMALTYLLALGAHFDIIINLDGFNEVALPPAENMPKNVFPFFPRNWFWRVQDLPDSVTRSIVGEITYLKSKRSKWARVFSKAPLRYSITLNLIWKYYDHNLATAISDDELTLQRYRPNGTSYVATGPSRHYETESALFEDLASFWKMSSLQMYRLSAANRIRYFHFLQPNQYVAGSKIMKKEESKRALLDGHPYKKGAERGYPYLIKAGEELVNQGVHFHDLTRIFTDKVEPIYVDACCHLNKTGNEIVGTVIGRAIIQDINTENTPGEKKLVSENGVHFLNE